MKVRGAIVVWEGLVRMRNRAGTVRTDFAARIAADDRMWRSVFGWDRWRNGVLRWRASGLLTEAATERLLANGGASERATRR